jgi:NAD(P)-dependent dehydrogenase (short-subunit alcohol dehydrogenase family)
MSYLALEGLHAFITGAAGGIATAAVKEFLGKNDNQVLCLWQL